MASSSYDNREVLDEVLVTANNNSNNTLVARKTLVGKVIAAKALNKTAVKGLMAKAWQEYENLQISDLGFNKFIFTFSEINHAKEVIARAPWYVTNHLLCLQHWIREVSPHELYFDENPVWIQVHNLPLEYLNSQNVTTILSKIGRVMEVEEPIVEGRVRRPYCRSKVRINVTNHYQLAAGFQEQIYRSCGLSIGMRG